MTWKSSAQIEQQHIVIAGHAHSRLAVVEDIVRAHMLPRVTHQRVHWITSRLRMCARHLQCTFRRQKCATYAPQVIYTFYMTLLSQSDTRNLQALPNLWQIMCARSTKFFGECTLFYAKVYRTQRNANVLKACIGITPHAYSARASEEVARAEVSANNCA